MGKMSDGEKVGAIILGVLLSPFFIVKYALEWIGIIKKPNYEYIPPEEDIKEDSDIKY